MVCQDHEADAILDVSMSSPVSGQVQRRNRLTSVTTACGCWLEAFEIQVVPHEPGVAFDLTTNAKPTDLPLSIDVRIAGLYGPERPEVSQKFSSPSASPIFGVLLDPLSSTGVSIRTENLS